MAEESYNSDKELILNTEGWSAWFYDQETNFHRLDAKSIRTKDQMTFGTKTIYRLFDVDTDNTVLVRNNLKTIYAIFAISGKKKAK